MLYNVFVTWMIPTNTFNKRKALVQYYKHCMMQQCAMIVPPKIEPSSNNGG